MQKAKSNREEYFIDPSMNLMQISMIFGGLSTKIRDAHKNEHNVKFGMEDGRFYVIIEH